MSRNVQRTCPFQRIQQVLQTSLLLYVHMQELDTSSRKLWVSFNAVSFYVIRLAYSHWATVSKRRYNLPSDLHDRPYHRLSDVRDS